MSVVVLVGNPRPASRTAALATTVGRGLADGLGLPLHVVDLAELGPAVLDPADGRVAEQQRKVTGAGVLVVATPVYKGAYTGLLKAFLDRSPADALTGTVVVPVVLAGSGADAGAAAVHLRALLVAIGAQVVLPGLVTTESALGDQPDTAAAHAPALDTAALVAAAGRWLPGPVPA